MPVRVVGTVSERLRHILLSGNAIALQTVLALPDYAYYFQQFVHSYIAMQAIANSQTAMQAVINSQTAMQAIANSQTAMQAVINSQTALDTIRSNTNAWNTFRNSTALQTRQVPQMTSNTTPEGVASASSSYGTGNEPWRAFDKHTGVAWSAATGVNTNQWLAYQFTAPVFVHTVTVRGHGGSHAPRNVRVQKSTDGVSWTDATTTITLQQTTNEQTIFVSSAGFATRWRLFIVDTYGYEPVIYELNFIGFAQS